MLEVALRFPALAAFIGAYTGTHEVVTPQDVRAYHHRAVALATAGFVASGVLPLVQLGLLVIFIGLAYLARL